MFLPLGGRGWVDSLLLQQPGQQLEEDDQREEEEEEVLPVPGEKQWPWQWAGPQSILPPVVPVTAQVHGPVPSEDP